MVVAVALAAAAAASGCGFGEGERTEGEAALTVTRDYGAEPVLEATISDPPESETVIRFLDREAEITTRFGGGFVQSINGVSGEIADGRTRDWFFFVNGIESSVGAAEVTVRGGDRIWWDYRDWTEALRTPAVVGSWPEPFAQEASGTDRRPVAVDCAGERPPCELVAERLADEGIEATVRSSGSASREDELRLLVGDWEDIRDDPLAAQLAHDPASSGVFARFRDAAGGDELVALDERGGEVAELGPGTGLVAGLRRGEDLPLWVITGTDGAGVEAAADLLDGDALADHYAVATTDGAELPLPAESDDQP
jgi:hypothetical protein